MLWLWIILGCVVVASLLVLEIRAERKPEKLSMNHRQGGSYPGISGGGVGGVDAGGGGFAG